MSDYATVLLRHECDETSHYDWMIEDPSKAPGEGQLLTWRIAVPSWRWERLGVVSLKSIAEHRRAYLNFEGELSRGRGRVTRVDRGKVRAHGWCDAGGLLTINMTHFQNRCRLDLYDVDHWGLRLA